MNCSMNIGMASLTGFIITKKPIRVTHTPQLSCTKKGYADDQEERREDAVRARQSRSRREGARECEESDRMGVWRG